MVAGKVLDEGFSISIEKGREFQENIYFCFTDYAKVGWHHRLNGHELEQTPGDGRTGKPGVLQSMGSQRVRHY